MTLFRLTLLVLSLSLFGFGCGGDKSTEAAGESGDEEAEDGDAGEDGEDEKGGEAMADASQPAVAAPAGDAGMASARMMGSWGIALPPEEKAKLDAARMTLEANPDDPEAEMMTSMMDAMLGAMKLVVTADSLTMGAGDKTQTIAYTVKEDSAEKAVLSTKENDGKEAVITVTYGPDGVMTWTKEGEPAPLMWARK